MEGALDDLVIDVEKVGPRYHKVKLAGFSDAPQELLSLQDAKKAIVEWASTRLAPLELGEHTPASTRRVRSAASIMQGVLSSSMPTPAGKTAG